MKILVVEDDKFLASAYKVKLEKERNEVVVAKDGQEALLLLENFSPNVIVLDLVMPNMDGFDLLKNIKLSEKHKNIPIVVASNLGQKEDIDKAMKLGATDFIVKSDLSMDDVVNKISSVVH